MKYFLFSAMIVCFLSCSMSIKNVTIQSDNSTQDISSRPTNIILLIGDGMGLTQISAGTYQYGNKSNFENFNVVGLHKSYAYDNLITDSAAGATAFACGIKTYNGAIGVNVDTMSVRTILEEAEEKGMSTGLIATSSITHATPASFIAHNEYRRNYEEIATDFLTTEVDYFVGGGLKYFNNRESDERDLVKELKQKGYQVDLFVNKNLDDVDINHDSNFAYFTHNSEPLPVSKGRDYLRTAVKKGIDHLSNHSDNGFFLMIEGSQIDWGGHANQLDYVLTEWYEFDQVLGDVLTWAESDQNTLVIVTADHETGGLAIQSGSKMDSISGAFTSDYHTGPFIPVFAQGPSDGLFSGIYENTSIYEKMRTALGWEKLK